MFIWKASNFRFELYLVKIIFEKKLLIFKIIKSLTQNARNWFSIEFSSLKINFIQFKFIFVLLYAINNDFLTTKFLNLRKSNKSEYNLHSVMIHFIFNICIALHISDFSLHINIKMIYFFLCISLIFPLIFSSDM